MTMTDQGSSNIGYMAKLEDEIEDLKTQIDDAKKASGRRMTSPYMSQ